MFSPHLALALIIIFNILPTPNSLTALKYGNELRDLYSVTGTCFTTEANTWLASQKFGTNVYNDPCGGYGIVGGYNVLKQLNDYLSKSYSGLPTHTWIYYTMTLYALDSWSYGSVGGGDDHFGVQFDTKPVIDGFRFNVYTFYENLCGASSNDLRNIRLFGRIPHSASTLTLKVIHLLDQDSTDESVAFREVNLIFASPSTAPTEAFCGRAPFTGFTGECSCPEGQYYVSGCQNCHANCESCWGPTASQCYQCRAGTSFLNGACTPCSTGCASCHGTADTDCDACLTGYYLFNSSSCIYPCSSPLVASTSTGGCSNLCSSSCTTITDYIYWDGSCASTCPAPLKPNTINKYIKSCEFPCPIGSYLYWDGSCSTSCLAPLTQSISQGKLYCNYSCADGEYAFWNGTCGTTCLPPLIQNYMKGRQFCQFPCTGTTYLYWNGSCIASCDFPLITRESYGVSYCDYPCKNNEFLYWDGSCEADCPSLLTTRVEGSPRSRNYCDFKGSITDYLYWDGTYHSTCDPLFNQSVFKGRSTCQYPCSLTDFLYWNGSCLSKCDLPLKTDITSGLQFCNFRCTTQTDYLYWDNSCSSSCDYPLTQGTVGGSSSRKLCLFPCKSNEVLYWNGTCLPSCVAPFISNSQNGRTICQYPCAYTEFLYYNGSCKDNCPFPFIPRKTNGVGYCGYPCSSTEYLFWNGSCMSACASPLRIVLGPNAERWCNLPCDSPLDYYYNTTGECKKTCDNRSVKQDDLYLICLPADPPQEPQGFMDAMLTPSAEPETPTLLVPNRFTQYLKYMDVTLPNRLNTLSSSRARNVISLKLNLQMPAALQTFFADRSLASVAEGQEVNPSFIINFWGDIMFLVGVAVLALIFQLIETVSQKLGGFKSQSFFEKLRLLTMWNLCFVLLGLNADDIIIYTYMEIHSASLTTPGGTVSLVIAIVMVVLVLGVVILGFYVAILFRVFRKEAIKKNKDDKCMEFHNGWKRFQVLYRGFVETSSLRQCFYMIYVLRMIIPQAILVGFIGSPFVQSISQVAISGIMLVYLLFLNPLKKRINQIQLLCFEAAGLTANIAILILITIPVSTDGRLASSHTRTFLGDLIILADLFINTAIVVFLVLKLLLEIHRLYKHFKANPKADKTVWLGLIVILIQQGAFGFEEVMGENLLDIDSRKIDNPYSRSNMVFPEPTATIEKSDEKSELNASPILVEKTNPVDEEASPMRNERKYLTGKERLSRMFNKKQADQGESGFNNESPTLDLDLSPDSPVLRSKISTQKSMLQMDSKHFELDNTENSPTLKGNTRLENLKLLKKKTGLPF